MSDSQKVIFGNHSSVIVPQRDRNSIRKFYCDVLGGVITKEENERDFLRLGDSFYIGFLYGDVPDESAFLRTARSVLSCAELGSPGKPSRYAGTVPEASCCSQSLI